MSNFLPFVGLSDFEEDPTDEDAYYQKNIEGEDDEVNPGEYYVPGVAPAGPDPIKDHYQEKNATQEIVVALKLVEENDVESEVLVDSSLGEVGEHDQNVQYQNNNRGNDVQITD
jgi:hypothetical protein